MALPNNLLTIYGRNPVIEALEDKNLKIYTLHLSKNNKSSDKIDKMLKLAKQRGIEIKYHSKEQLSRISKNGKQDQGVALDIVLDNFITLQDLQEKESFKILALDGIENPQNLGMIIRSATAGDIDAIILPKKGSASLVSPLTIKASVGTIFKLPILQTNSLYETLKELAISGAKIITLDLSAKNTLKELKTPKKAIFVLGNESKGVSKEINSIANYKIKIPMKREVESLNVAITASLIALCI
jgi:23S rRNA (guanosine2251-2'-O)-methyltransferase